MKIGDVCRLLNDTELSGDTFLGDGYLIPKGEEVVILDIFGGGYLSVKTRNYKDDKGKFEYIVMPEELELINE